MGESPASIALHMKQHPEGDGVVLGDETRLRQIVTNLARYGPRSLRKDTYAEFHILIQQRMQIYTNRWQTNHKDPISIAIPFQVCPIGAKPIHAQERNVGGKPVRTSFPVRD